MEVGIRWRIYYRRLRVTGLPGLRGTLKLIIRNSLLEQQSYFPCFLLHKASYLLASKAHIEPSNLYQAVCLSSISHNCGYYFYQPEQSSCIFIHVFPLIYSSKDHHWIFEVDTFIPTHQQSVESYCHNSQSHFSIFQSADPYCHNLRTSLLC